ncbi:hypothetical protein BN7_4907 [Wickerhamomyces ciferrii]|uniref:Protein kinase domain-containing protein n=1 Tax=Wickerhamomyces ciferrii (strain ATCC 14091 / BCRC 22168 / CBS 111 / JCM 3599 / NBRC 0793 / NRRL Y-1031 F-60-10) TaxID=1206466 RepID=K0KJC0_WICCF|nr:uncharacterized protein BN7_4907 [Wickerhamomyces ciferrii]CCH45325.1 hypothetical protein BN7_4907 [Wickerhamomyces ciferrii]
MFRTPPLKSSNQFETPAKQVISSSVGDSEVIDGDYHKVHINTEYNQNKSYLPTPKTPITPHDTSLSRSASTASKKRSLSINTSNDFQYFKNNQNYPMTTTSPLSSPVSIFSNESSVLSATSPHLVSDSTSPHLKYLPSSSLYSDSEIAHELEDFIIDPSFKFLVANDQIIGKGSFSTVLKSKFNNKDYAIKIPSKLKSCKPIYKEALNYKIITSYLQLHEFSLDEFPILNVFGLTYLTRADYHRIRLNENLPCLVSSCLSSNLEVLIKDSFQNKQNKECLHIGNDLWWKLAKQLIMGLIAFKDCDMLHLDLKTSNILFDSESENFKIADLTSAGLFDDVVKEFHERLNSGFSMDYTLQYAAPEILNKPKDPPNYQTDLYSIGLILLTAAIGDEPYSQVLSESRSNFIYLTECIKKNKVIDIITGEQWEILRSNPLAYKLIKSILIDRVDLQEVVGFLSEV